MQIMYLGDYQHPQGLLYRDAWGIYQQRDLVVVGTFKEILDTVYDLGYSTCPNPKDLVYGDWEFKAAYDNGYAERLQKLI